MERARSRTARQILADQSKSWREAPQQGFFRKCAHDRNYLIFLVTES